MLQCIERLIKDEGTRYGNPEDARANEKRNEIRGDLTPSSYLNWARKWVQEGATLIGGCCGIGPEHITVLSQKLVYA